MNILSLYLRPNSSKVNIVVYDITLPSPSGLILLSKYKTEWGIVKKIYMGDTDKLYQAVYLCDIHMRSHRIGFI